MPSFVIQHPRYYFFSILFLSSWMAVAATNSYTLTYRPAPADNPLKGLFPYAGSYTTFPHSMEWGYLPLRSLMAGPTNFDWTPLENLLSDIARRRHQAVFRVYLDYPSKPTGIPQYLLDAGLTTRTYTDYGNAGISVSPNYENLLLRQALTNFIAAFGARYDGDPRIGFITVGLLGFWGEWHTYPYDWWFASLAVQNEVLTAYESAFSRTRLLVRRPAGTKPALRQLGYHDDSFAYSTLDPPSWAFLGLLKAAGETNKWQTQPIGGEVRPEVQRCMWDTNQPTCVPAGQDYSNCVSRTHASWMLNHGAFVPGWSGAEKERAVAGAQQLGYEFYVENAVLAADAQTAAFNLTLGIRNTGVAPFYYDWPVIIRVLNSNGLVVQTWTTPWKLSTLLPAATNTTWSYTRPAHGLPSGVYTLLLAVPNPLTNGLPVRFANESQDADLVGWLTLGQLTVSSSRSGPILEAIPSEKGFGLRVLGAAPGLWNVEYTSAFGSWSTLATTNSTTTEWELTDDLSAPARLYRVVGTQSPAQSQTAPALAVPDDRGKQIRNAKPPDE